MLATLLGVFIPLAYIGIGAALTRPVYGFLRAKSIETAVRRKSALAGNRVYVGPRDIRGRWEFDLNEWNRWKRGEVMSGTVLLCIFWPVGMLYPLGPALRKYMLGSKIKSQPEIEAEYAAMSKRIGELEKELGI